MICLQAHRGAKGRYPENTFPAYYGAIREGYSFIELDTKFSKDNVCVILHDRSINRTGRHDDGSPFETELLVSEMTVSELKEVDFGIGFAPEFAGTRIPTLEELLAFIRETRMPVKLDNVIQTATAEQLESVFQAIEKSGVEELVGICGNTVDFIRLVADRLPKVILHYDGPTGPEIYPELKDAANGHDLSIWLPNEKKSWLPYPPATEEDVLLARRYGHVGLWTAHNEETLRQIVALQPDAMEIDDGITPEDVRREEALFAEKKNAV